LQTANALVHATPTRISQLRSLIVEEKIKNYTLKNYISKQRINRN